MPEKRIVPFRQVDIARAIRGALAGGMAVGRVVIDREGRIVLDAADKAPEPASAFDTWKAKRDARSA